MRVRRGEEALRHSCGPHFSTRGVMVCSSRGVRCAVGEAGMRGFGKGPVLHGLRSFSIVTSLTRGSWG